MSSQTSRFDGATCYASSPDEVPVSELRSVLEDRRVGRIRGGVVAFASLHRHLKPGEKDFSSFAHRAGQAYGKLDR